MYREEKMNNSCPLNKKDCNKEKIINIIELKKGKIKETNICENCLDSYLENQTSSQLPPEAFSENLTLKEKMNAAIEAEDYETAALIKKQIESKND